jgi:hypothetical protein
MTIAQPYYRIWRPMLNDDFFQNDYVLDPRYARDAIDLIRGYHLLERELFRLFDFVEPADANLECYSHQLYAILLKASTEFEANAKEILRANGYQKRSLNITDYHKLQSATRLADYAITVPIWKGSQRTFRPFDEWKTGSSLAWYQAYNRVKHSRSEHFESASLENVAKGVAAVLAITFAQFGISAFDPYHDVGSFQSNGNLLSHSACLLSLEPPKTWTPAEHYDFDWEALNLTASPFQRYTF